MNSIKELLDNKDITNINWIQTNEQIADVLTKRGVSGQNIINALNNGLL